MAALAFEMQHGVDHVFQHAGASDGAPSLVTWPTRTMANFPRFGEPDQIRSWRRGPGATVPGGAVDRASSHMVWMESITTRAASPADCRLAAMSRRLGSRRRGSSGASWTPRRRARRRICSMDSSPEDVEHAAGRRGPGWRRLAASGWICRCPDHRRHQGPPRPGPRPPPSIAAIQFGDAGGAARRRFRAAGQADEFHGDCRWAPRLRGRARAAMASSTMLFHSPQLASGRRPIFEADRATALDRRSVTWIWPNRLNRDWRSAWRGRLADLLPCRRRSRHFRVPREAV